NNITSISTRDDWWKHQQYILATQARQVFYLKDPSRSHHWRVVQDVNHRKIWDKDIIVDADVIHETMSSNLALTANLEDLDYRSLSGVGPSTEMALVLGRGHGGDNGPPDDDRLCHPPPYHTNEKAWKRARDGELKKKFRLGGKKKLPIKFDVLDQKTVKPVGENNHNFTSLIGNEIERVVPFYFKS
ncbi:formin-like protein 18, partial [Tanacetum coccineum]